MKVKFKIETILTLSLGLVFFVGYRGGIYFLHNKIQELALLLTIVLFFSSSYFCALKNPPINWTLWTFVPLLIVTYAMVVPSITWARFAGVSALPSILASREFIIILIAPTIYFLYHLGYPVKKIETVFIGTAVLVSLSYIFHDLRIDKLSYYLSSDVWMKNLVTADSWRGYRLKAPTLAMNIGTLASFVYIFTKKGFWIKSFWLLVLILMIDTWLIAKARSEMALLAVGIVIYHLWFAFKNRLGLFVTSMLIAIPFLFYASYALFDHLSQADPSDKVRYYSYLKTFDAVSENPLLGVGQGSYKSKTEGDLFGKFSSSDLGVFGIAFKFGFIGVFIYYGTVTYVFQRVIKASFAYRKNYLTFNLLLVISIIRITKEYLLFMMSLDYVYIMGLLLAGVAFAVASIYLYEDRFKV